MGLKMMSVRFSNVIDENLEIEKLKIHFLDAERIITNRKILFHQKLRKFLKEILSQDSSLIPLFYACQDFVLSDYQKTDSARKILEKEGLDRIVLHHLIAEAEESHEEGLIVFNHREKFMDILNSFLGDFPGIEDHFSVIKYMRDYIGILMIKADVLKKALDEISASDVNLQKSKHPKKRHQKFGKSSMVLPENDKRCEDPKLCKLAKELGKDPMVIVQQLDEDPNASTAYIDGDFRLLKRIINKDPMGAPKTKLSKKRTQPKKQPNGKANKKPKARPAREMSSGKIADKEKEHQTVSLQKEEMNSPFLHRQPESIEEIAPDSKEWKTQKTKKQKHAQNRRPMIKNPSPSKGKETNRFKKNQRPKLEEIMSEKKEVPDLTPPAGVMNYAQALKKDVTLSSALPEETGKVEKKRFLSGKEIQQPGQEAPRNISQEDIPSLPLEVSISPAPANSSELSALLLNFPAEETVPFDPNMRQEAYYPYSNPYPQVDYRDWQLAQVSMEKDQLMQAFDQLQRNHYELLALFNNLVWENRDLRQHNFEEFFGRQCEELRKMGIPERVLGEKNNSH